MAPAHYKLPSCTALLVYERGKFIPSNKLQHLIQHLPLSRVSGHLGSIQRTDEKLASHSQTQPTKKRNKQEVKKKCYRSQPFIKQKIKLTIRFASNYPSSLSIFLHLHYKYRFNTWNILFFLGSFFFFFYVQKQKKTKKLKEAFFRSTLSIFKARLDGTPGSLIWWVAALHTAVGLELGGL